MATLITLSIKQQNGSFKNYTISVYDEVDQFGNNVAMYEEQTKEERESKAKKTYLGNGKVVWTNGIMHLAPKKEKQSNPTTTTYNVISPPKNIEVIEVDNVTRSDVDDLPF